VTVFTIGHSNRPFEPYLEALQAHGIALVADVRRFPSSRRHPYFSRSRLEPALAHHGIAYRHMLDLGGHREPLPNSPNTAWRDPAFRGYADYMQTPAFALAVGALLEEAGKRPTAIMCAELRWRECHRGLISDFLKAAGHDVVHVISAIEHEPHPYTRQARIVEGHLSYRGLL
jgi:uncharacterized protein (DUF488 family)